MNYLRLLSRLYNCPLCIAESKLDVITSEVTMKLLSGQALATDVEPTEHSAAPKGTAVVNVFDGLVSKNGAGSSGSTSYESIITQTKRHMEAGHKKIYYYLDTPGGEVSGLFGAAKFINSLPGKYGIETVGITDGMMASAGYVLGASTQKLYATESSIVGSIGVIMTLMNSVKADEEAGREYKILRSKDDKAKLNPHEAFDDEAIEDAMSMLGTLDTIMNDTVSSFRPSLDLKTIIDLKGGTVLGTEALELGLIDGLVASFDEVIKMEKEDNKLLLTNTTGNTNMTLEEAQAQIIQLNADVAALKAQESLTVAAATQEERTRVLGIIEAANTFKLSTTSAIKRIKASSSVEDSVSMFEEIAEATQENNSLDTTNDNSTINGQTIPQETNFSTQLDAALEAAATQQPLFAGIK